MSRPAVYSLWLIPTGEVHERLSHLIHDLAREYGAPAFEPHVTLVGSVPGSENQLRAGTRELASLLRPLQLRTMGLGCEDVYFRSLYLKVRKSQPLMRAHRRALESFSLSPTDYVPHISLLYSDRPRSMKQAILSQLRPLPSHTFEVNSIHVVDTSGSVESWKELGRSAFG